MPLFICIVILAVLSATLVMLRINKREDEILNQQEDEDSIVVSMFHGVEDDILNNAN